MSFQELSQFKYHVNNVINKMEGIKKCRQLFLVNSMSLFLSIKGRINFLQLQRFSGTDEQTFRNHFEKSFDFLKFNLEIVKEHGGGHYTIGFDPCYISKSGKSTPGVNWFWSGCAGTTKWGLEIGGIAAIDIENHTAFHLEAKQTVFDSEKENLVSHYAKLLIDRKDQLKQLSKYVVADAYFAKETFISKLLTHDFEVVTRLRDDANLLYKFMGQQKGGRGRPKKHDGKIDFKNLKTSYFKQQKSDETTRIYSGVVFSKSLKTDILIAIVYINKKDKWSHKIYMSTDLNLTCENLLSYYQTRFQIEFIYRDGKQHTGLNDCEARSENKLDFHFNMSLTSINIAKITHWLSLKKEERKSFSMADVKTMYHNELMLKRFFIKFGINPNLSKNKTKALELLNYGKIAA
jgi:hypothetical protein